MDCVFMIISRIPAATVVVKNTVTASIDLDGSAGVICQKPDSIERVRVK